MSTVPPQKKPSAGLRLAIDAGPLVVFFAVNQLAGGPQLVRALTATAAFMVAIAVAMIVSRIKLGRISPMLWLSGGLVVVFGGLTLWFRDTTFIKVKPTLVYAMLSAVLAFGLATGRPLLQTMLESAYPGLTSLGWRKLTVNWAVFFAVMAVANEIAWRVLAPGDDLTRWAAVKLWVALPATFVFALANIPMLLKHGLMIEEARVPPEGSRKPVLPRRREPRVTGLRPMPPRAPACAGAREDDAFAAAHRSLATSQSTTFHQAFR